MKPFYALKVILLVAVLCGLNLAGFAQTAYVTYTSTAPQTFICPAGVSAIYVDMWGAAGGVTGGTATNVSRAGYGGRVQGVLSVTPGQVYFPYVGGVGGNGSTTAGGAAGVNGGGAGAFNPGPSGTFPQGGGGGGGGSDIRTGGTAFANRIIVAGGGGGDAYDQGVSFGDNGGDGGGLTGTVGLCSYNAAGGGKPGTNIAGGIGGTGTIAGFSGGPGVGGAATPASANAGGGGGGYFGGGGGSNGNSAGLGGGGGGGSSYTSPTLVSSFTHTQAYNTAGNGSIAIYTPTLTATPVPASFGTVVVNSVSATPTTITIGSAYLVGIGTPTVNVTAPAGFLVSATGTAGSFTSSINLTYTSPVIPASAFSQSVYIEFAPTAYSTYTSTVVVTGGGATINVPVTGTGYGVCSGTPSISSATTTSSGSTNTVSITPITSVAGITYQWQSVSDTSTIGFANIAGANSASYTFPNPPQNTYFRCVVTCTYSGQSVTSNIVLVATNTTVQCTGTPSSTSYVYATPSAGCAPGYSTTVYLNTSNTDPSYTDNFEVSTTGSSSGFTAVSGGTLPYLTIPVTGTFWIRDSITCAGTGGSYISRNTPAQQITLNPLPSAIGGPTNVCIGTATQFTSSPAGGVWTINNPALLSIGASTGIASGIAPGSASVTYTLPTGCLVTTTAAVNLGASSIIGSSTVCPGTMLTLSDLVTGGSWTSSLTSAATVGTASGIVTGVAAGTSVITYTLSDGCTASLPIVVNPLPAAITGAATVCVGSTDVLSDVTAGGAWSSSDVFQAPVGAASGIATGVAAGRPVISYTLPTGCQSTLTLTVNAVPAAITGNPVVCVGSATTLADIGAGAWSTSNASLATVGATGIVSGVAAGMPLITFTRTSTGCFITTTATVNALPISANVTEPAGGGFCPGGAGVHIGLDASYDGTNYYLYEGSTLVDSLRGATSALDFGVYNSVGTYSVLATNVLTGCTLAMTGSATVYNYTIPTADSVLGGGSFCAGGAGVNVYMNNSDVGVHYQLYVGGVATGAAVAGTGGYLGLGPQTAPGYYTATAMNITTLCTNTMLAGATVTVLSTPAIDTLSPGGHYCLGGNGVNLSLGNSSLGIYYKLYHNGVLDSTVLSVGGPVSFGNQTAAGNYTVVALNNMDLCTSIMSDTAKITIDSLPVIYSATGGGVYCYGTGGRHIGVAYSVVGTNYMLYDGSTLVSTLAGANSGLDFGAQTTPGTYTIVGKYASSGCLDTMGGSVTISVDSLPAAFNVTGTAGYCFGGSGVPVTLSGSGSGHNFKYRLYMGATPIGPYVTGTGSAITFGPETVAGTYTVIALDTISTCTRTMSDSAVVTINPLPLTYNVTGSGNYCTGGPGLPVMLSGSQAGIAYHLENGGSIMTTSTGTGSSINFGLQTVTGNYTVVATNTVTGCTMNMTGSATIGTLPLPALYLVSGGGTECAGGAGFPVHLAVSSPGVSYRLYNTGYVGSALLGTGSELSFGMQTAAGNYKVIATDVSTGCSDTMTGSAPIVVHPSPGRYALSGGGSFCEGTSGALVGLASSDSTGGVMYQLYNGMTATGAAIAGTGHALSFGLQTAGGTYTAVATSSFGCSDTMSPGVLITANPAPSIYTVGGGGTFCAGDTGVHIYLSNSNTYVNYQVYRSGSIAVGSFWAGTGLRLDLGLDSVGGTYTVVGVSVLTGCSSSMSGSATLVVTPLVTPAVIMHSTGDTVCAGSSVSFTPVATNGGSAPTYQWTVDGIMVSSGPSYSYIPSSGDIVTVTLTSNAMCASPLTAASSAVITVNANETPVVNISTPNTLVCRGTSVTFTSSASYGGASPSYSWNVNGHSVGVSTPTYTYVPNNNDAVQLSVTSDYPCLTHDYVLSNAIIITSDTAAVPSITISGGNNVTHLQALTLTADVSNVPASMLSYQWQVNYHNVAGANSATFSSSSFNNGDVVCCSIFSTNSCGNSATATECETITVNGNLGVANVTSGNDIHVVPNPNKGAFIIKGTLSVTTDENVTLEVTDMLGQVVYSGIAVAHGGVINEQIMLGSGIANGMYLLNVRAAGESNVFHFVVEQ